MVFVVTVPLYVCFLVFINYVQLIMNIQIVLKKICFKLPNVAEPVCLCVYLCGV